MGLAWFIPRRNAVPTLAAVIAGAERPQRRRRTSHAAGDVDQTPPLSRTDIREPPDTNPIVAPNALTDKMRYIIQQLQLPKAVYEPQKYANPSLQWFYRILQALALEEDLPENADDRTLPRWRQIHKRGGAVCGGVWEGVGGGFRMWQRDHQREGKPTANGGVKRGMPASSSAAADGTAKKVKREDGEGGEGVSEEEMRTAYEKDVLSKFTVANLKGWLLGKGLGASGKKADLVDAVTRHFETKMDVD